jgi:hypothetical protein
MGACLQNWATWVKKKFVSQLTKICRKIRVDEFAWRVVLTLATAKISKQ